MSRENLTSGRKSPKQLSPVKGGNLNSIMGQRSLVPPVLQEVGKLAAGVAAVASGSSTGNPRNKHALQPGHSLMDWIRLGSSGKDLTGVGSRAGQLSITPRQLAQHDKEADAWIAIRGKVYNVTEYLSFHPGGPEELMKGIGKDATTLFDQVHAWVNYESLLQKCYLGRLVAIDPEIDTEELFFGKSDRSPKSPKEPPQLPNNTTSPKILSPKFLPPNKVTPVDEPKLTNSMTKDITENFKEIIEPTPPNLPRFDWIQKTDYITIIFYTKAFTNPSVQISPPQSDNSLIINLSYENQSFSNEVKFLKPIQWPCQTKINYETGKVDVQFKKSESMIWENYGVLKQKSAEESSTSPVDFKHSYTIINKIEVNYNTSLLELQRNDEGKLTVPIGKHVRVFGTVQGEELSRSYTPVPHNLFTKFKPQTFITDNICLMVKSYPKGSISKYIGSRRKGDTLEISKPLGSFSLSSIENRETFLLLAAGTGITPMLSVILFLLDRRIRKCQNITLLFFNRTEEDILIRNQLETLQSEDNRLRVEYVLSNADPKWSGLKGQISPEILQGAVKNHLMNSVYKQFDIFALICGPTPFTSLSNTLLVDLGFKKDQIHTFIG